MQVNEIVGAHCPPSAHALLGESACPGNEGWNRPANLCRHTCTKQCQAHPHQGKGVHQYVESCEALDGWGGSTPFYILGGVLPNLMEAILDNANGRIYPLTPII